jgi:hypothetical protein
MRKHIIFLVAVLAALGTAATAVAAPTTKQNGGAPAFATFTSVCTPLPTYEGCDGNHGDPSTFAKVTGKVNAIQAKSGIYNLGISFSGLVAGESYKLYGYHTTGDPNSYFVNDLRVGDDNGGYGWTVVTSYWSGQPLTVGPGGLV